MDVGCDDVQRPAANNSNPSGDHADDTFDVASRFIELEQLDPTKELWKDIYGRTGIKKGYIGLFLEKELSKAYQEFATAKTEAEFNQYAVVFQAVLNNVQAASKHSFEETYYASPDVALLSNGFVDENADLLLKRIQEPIRENKDSFNAASMKNQPVLVIPSGGFMGLNSSTFFKSALDEYVKNGGTVIVFSQQHGYDYSVLPTPDGKPLAAYGWAEDQNCFWDGSYLDSYHQTMSSISTPLVSAGVDGYFTSWPTNATILLRRTANGQPALLMYDYGQGKVIVSSFYSDWGAAHAQATKQEIAIVRDLISWGKKPAVLPEIKLGETVSVPVTVSNSSATEAASIKFQIYTPDRSLLLNEQSVSTTIPVGGSSTSNVTWQAPSNAALGIYHIDYLLLDAAGNIIQPQAETDSGRFVVSNPPQAGTVKKEIWLSITSPNQEVFFNEPFVYAFHIFNNSATTRKLTLKTLLPHTGRTHEWPVTATANSETVINGSDLFIDSNMFETLRAYLYDENNVQIGSYMLSFKGVFPQVGVTTATAKPLYTRGETVDLGISLGNNRSLATTAKLKVTVTDPANSILFNSSADVILPASSGDARRFSFPLPQAAQGGVYAVSTEVLDVSGKKIGGDSAAFEIPLRLVAITPSFPADWQAGVNPFSVNLANQGIMPVTAGIIGATLTDPDNAAVASVSQPFTLDAGQTKNLDLSLAVPPLKFGAYILVYNQGDEAGAGKNSSVSLVNSISIAANFDKPSYRTRETANLTVNLANDGKFLLDNVALTVTATDFGYATTQTIALSPKNSGLYKFPIPIPGTITPGQHTVTAVIALPSGSIFSRNLAVTIPESSLELGALTTANWTAGDTVRLPLNNTGGEDTTADFIAELYDAKYIKVAGISSTAIINSGSTTFIDFPVSRDITTGAYYLQTSHHNRKTDKTVYGFQKVVIAGAEVVFRVTTSKDWYQPNATVSGTTALTLNSGELANATLDLKVLSTSADQSVTGLKWWNKSWKYRQPLVVNVGNVVRENYPFSVDFNFTNEFIKSGKSGTFDENSLRVIEYDADGNVLKEIPSQFDKAADYVAASNAKGSIYLIMDGVIPAGSVRRYAVYFDALENSPKTAADYPVVPATLDNTNKFWKTDGVYLKWGGYAYRSYYNLADIIADLKFDDNNNNDPTDDFDRLQNTDALGTQWYGFLGSGYFTGFGGSTGIITRQGPVFVEMTLGKATFRYYMNNKRWIECNGAVDFMFNFGPVYNYVKSGNKAEKNIVSGSWFENYYNSATQPGYLAYRASSKNLILGAIAKNVTNYACDNRLDPAHDRILSFDDSSTNSAARIYWYSDTTGSYEKIGKFSENILNPLNLIPGTTEIYAEDGTSTVIWEKNIPISVTGSENVVSGISLPGNIQGKLFLKGTLFSALNQIIAQDIYPFYIATSNMLLSLDTDKRVAKRDESVTIAGKVTNLDMAEATNLILTLKTKSAARAEQIIYTEAFTLPSGESRSFSQTTVAETEGVVALTATVTQNSSTLAEITDKYEVANPKVTAILTAPDVVGNDPFNLTLTLTNSGKTDSSVTVLPSLTSLPETVTIPAGQVKLLQYSQQISADTIDTFTLSGDLAQVITKTVKYGLALALVATPQPIYLEGKISLPMTVTNSGLIDNQYDVNYQLVQEASSVSQQAKSYFLPKGTNSIDTLFYDLPEGNYQLTASSLKPVASASTAFQVRKETKAELTLAIGAQSGNLLPTTVTAANLGYNPIDGVVRLSLIAENGIAAWSAVQEVNLPQSLNPGPQALAFSINLSTLVPGRYTVKAELLDGGNRQLAAQTAPFTHLGPTIAITQLPQYRTIPSGGSSDFTFKVKNSGNQEGKFELHFKADDLIDATRGEWLKPGEEKEITFSLQAASDLDEKDYFATYSLKPQGTGSEERGTVRYRLRGLNLAVTATLDRQAYNPGDTATLTLTVTQQDAGAAPNLFARVNYNGYNEKQSFALTGSRTLTFNVPLRQVTGEKLFYGIYAESGRSIHLNTMYVHKADAELAISTDKQVYNPGETVTAAMLGRAAGDLTLSGPGDYSTTFAFSGSATKSFTLPATMTAGTYTLNAQLKTQNSQLITVSYPFDVAGIQVKVKEALLDKTKYAATDAMQLSLTIESNQDFSSTVRTWVVDPSGSYTEAGSSEVTLTAIQPLLFTLHSSLDTGSLGIHKLVYGIYQGDLLLASGAKAFDIGEAVLMGLATDRTDYPEITLPVTVKADLYGTTTAAIDLFLDGVSIGTDNVTLSGAGDYTFAIPSENVAPGLRVLKAVLRAGGLTSSKETRFTYGSRLPDLTGRISAQPPLGGSMNLSLTVANQGKTAAGASRATLYDGDPANGGLLLVTLNVPAIDAGSSVALSHAWSILGRSGEHVLYARIDSYNSVAEFIEGNNIALTAVSLPSAGIAVSTGKSTYGANEAAAIAITLANLTANLPIENSTLKLRLTSDSGAVIDLPDRAVGSIAPATAMTLAVVWNTGTTAPAGYTITVRLVAGETEIASGTSLFTVVPTAQLSGSITPAVAEAPQDSYLDTPFTVMNSGNIPIDGTLQAAIKDPQNGITMGLQETALQLPVGAAKTGTFSFPLAGLPIKGNGLLLGFVSVSAEYIVAQSQFSIIDTIPPALTVSALSDGSYTNSETLNVAGTVSDNSGAAKVEINSATVPVAADGTFSQAVLLQSGGNTLTTVAADGAGNKSTDSRTIILDKAAPALTLTAPADNSKTAVSPIELKGSVDESSTVTVKHGESVQTAAMDGPAFAATVLPAPGWNTIEVTATDLAGNPSSQKRSVLFDDQAPSLAITEPNQDIRTNRERITISGTATDPYTAIGVTLAMDGNIMTPPVVGGIFSQIVAFGEEKLYPVTVTATNEVGTQVSAQRNVIFDKTPPSLTIDPVATPTNSSSQTVTGTREEGTAVEVSCATATVGAIEYPAATTWRATITGMQQGENRLRAEVNDLAGNRTTATATILYVPKAPEVTLSASPDQLWPPNKKLVPVTISGTVLTFGSDIKDITVSVADEYGKYNMQGLRFGDTVLLEAWRDGNDMDGRVYTITAVVTDQAGNRTTRSTTVVVPHDMGK